MRQSTLLLRIGQVLLVLALWTLACDFGDSGQTAQACRMECNQTYSACIIRAAGDKDATFACQDARTECLDRCRHDQGGGS